MAGEIGIDDLLGSPGPVEGRADELAEWLGLSSRQIYRHETEGHVVKLGKNRFDLQASVRTYCEWLRDQAHYGRPATGTAKSALAEENLRLKREQADAVALKNAQARGELVPAENVEREWSGVLRTVRAAMLSIPARVQARLAHLSADDVAVIDREVRDALTETAKGKADD
ncbi:terminase small subunit [Erythrobacter rubeus]|uniref:Terminase small subunit n=1 Tax=Erythrobacter rubeus TaxID=2760803 RepID=A0ABR8KNL5_9SPHN|nr:terminase small subunit [Erythrobacter rubeus]MBD2842241.1 terminase small subunit [Erythrobacter rubeus]